MFSRFFIYRPIFASVLSIVVTLAGGIAVWSLPVAQYPEITPPTVEVSASYPGADSQTLADTVAAPIEQQVNGVEGMMYMSSQCANDGSYTLTVTFKLGVDLDMAQVLVQNRVAMAAAGPARPGEPQRREGEEEVAQRADDRQPLLARRQPQQPRTEQLRHDPTSRRIGAADRRGRHHLPRTARLQHEALARSGKNGLSQPHGQRRGPRRPAAEHPGRGRPDRPAAGPSRASFSIHDDHPWPIDRRRPVRGHDFEDGPDGPHRSHARRCPRRSGRPELRSSVHAGRPAVGRPVDLPVARLERPEDRPVRPAKMEELRKRFPAGIEYAIVYDTTPFITESIGEVFKTLRDAVILVALVVLLFLQNWRSAVIPLIAVPVAIVGTFAVMAAMNFSLNNLTLFGLVLAIGIVVDDAIVVVEAVEYHIEHGMTPREASIKAMSQVSGPVIAVGLVLSAVFVPCAFISGIMGQFFRQFALTIAVSTLLSAFNSLTLSPALAAVLLRPHAEKGDEVLPRLGYFVVGGWLGYAQLMPWLEQWLATPLAAMLGRKPFSLVLDGFVSAAGAAWWIIAAAAVVSAAVLCWEFAGGLNWILGGAFRGFNRGFNRCANAYTSAVGATLRHAPWSC